MNLLAGPWIGEFGWELMAWQGVLRHQSRFYDHTVIICQPGHEFLYRDFADSFVNFSPQGNEPDMWRNRGTMFAVPKEYAGFMWIKPQNFFRPNAPMQRHRCFGPDKEPGRRNLICYHARNISKYGDDCINFPREKWEELLEDMPEAELACIGTRRGSMYIKGLDMRGASLQETCLILGNSKVILGPSSGPIHLASLCRTKQVVWSGYERSVKRYKKEWNPFDVPTVVINEGDQWSQRECWQPTIDQIKKGIEECESYVTPLVQ